MINVNDHTSFVSSRELIYLIDNDGYEVVGDLKHILEKNILIINEDESKEIYLIEIYINRKNKIIDIFSKNLLSSLYTAKNVHKIFNLGGFN